jgi:hypothetical protein
VSFSDKYFPPPLVAHRNKTAKPCKFFSTRKTCSEGNKCRLYVLSMCYIYFRLNRHSIHDVEKSKWARKADSPSQAHRTTPSELPSTPCSLQEELKARNYYPITWRVIGGGVMMGGYSMYSIVSSSYFIDTCPTGLPCKAFAAGYCPDGNDCRLAHETEVWTSGEFLIWYLSRELLTEERGSTREWCCATQDTNIGDVCGSSILSKTITRFRY